MNKYEENFDDIPTPFYRLMNILTKDNLFTENCKHVDAAFTEYIQGKRVKESVIQVLSGYGVPNLLQCEILSGLDERKKRFKEFYKNNKK